MADAASTLVFSAVLMLFASACRSPHPEVAVDAAAPVAYVVTKIEAAAPNPADGVRAAVERWNAAHNAHDGDALATLYAPHVAFYGSEVTAARCVAQKRAAFKAQPDYAQAIRDVVIQPSEGGAMTVRFLKTSTSRGKSTDYPSYLVVQRDLHISDESDDVTDRNLRTKASRALKAASAATTCEEAIGEISGLVETRYQGMSRPGAFGIDNSAVTGNAVNPGDTEYCSTIRETIVDDAKTGEAHSTRLYTECIDFATGRTVVDGVLAWDEDAGTDETVFDAGAARAAAVVRLCHK